MSSTTYGALSASSDYREPRGFERVAVEEGVSDVREWEGISVAASGASTGAGVSPERGRFVPGAPGLPDLGEFASICGNSLDLPGVK